jgi:hypothetical protein
MARNGPHAGPFPLVHPHAASSGVQVLRTRKGHAAVTPGETKPGTIGAMHSMIELHPRPDALDGLGLPAIPYPVALPAFQAAVANDGELPLADMLHGLQLRAADSRADWQRMEPAMARLAELLAPDDARDAITAEGKGWSLDIGPVDLAGDVVTLQRVGTLLAAIAPGEEGRLRLAAYRPLDGRAIELLLALAATSDLQPVVPSGAHWQRAWNAAADIGKQHGDGSLTHLCRGGVGAAIGDDGGEAVAVRAQHPASRRPACVAAEIGTFHMLRRDAD